MPRREVPRIVGWLLLVPFAVVLVVQGIVPTVMTVVRSTQDGSFLDATESVGADNYAALGPEMASAWANTIVIGVLPLLVAVLLGIGLGAATAGGVRVPRLVGRGLLAVPMGCFAPVGMSVSAIGDGVLRDVTTDTAALTAGAQVFVVGVGLASALMGTALLAAIQPGTPNASGEDAGRLSGALVVAGVGLLGAVAMGLQVLTVPLVLFGGGPGASTQTAGLLGYSEAFVTMRMGVGAAVGVMILVPVMILGVLATAAIVATATRAEIVPAGRRGGDRWRDVSSGQVAWAVIGLVVVGGFVAVFCLTHGSWLADVFGGGDGAEGMESSQALTWLPTFAGALLQVAFAGLGAFAIGWVRPLGRRSEWLLLAAAPGLFVTFVPVSVAFFLMQRSLGTLNSPLALIPSLLNVPALVVLTLVFAAARRARDRQVDAAGPGSPRRGLMVPVAAGAGLVFVVSWVVQAQNLFQPFVAGNRRTPSIVADVMATRAYGSGGQIAPQSYPGWLLVIVVAALAVCLLGCDRLVVRAGRRRSG